MTFNQLTRGGLQQFIHLIIIYNLILIHHCSCSFMQKNLVIKQFNGSCSELCLLLLGFDAALKIFAREVTNLHLVGIIRGRIFCSKNSAPIN